VTGSEPQKTTRGQRGRQPPVLADLTAHQQKVVRLRFAHLQEVETRFRSGDPLRPGSGAPRPQYDPQRTTLAQRRAAKVAELKALGADEAALLGFKHISVRTLERYATLLAIREQEDAGLNIVTDGEIRRESYSNHFATPRKQCEDSTSDESVRERLDEVSAGKWWSTASHEGPKNL
jgi:hypothetical protein